MRSAAKAEIVIRFNCLRFFFIAAHLSAGHAPCARRRSAAFSAMPTGSRSISGSGARARSRALGGDGTRDVTRGHARDASERAAHTPKITCRAPKPERLSEKGWAPRTTNSSVRKPRAVAQQNKDMYVVNLAFCCRAPPRREEMAPRVREPVGLARRSEPWTDHAAA